MQPKLSIELVPATSWYDNVRSEVSGPVWDQIRRKSYQKADYKCEICGGKGEKHPVECHEIWHYDDQTHQQTLTGFIALCPTCHEVKHMGRTVSTSTVKKIQKVIDHICRVNQMTPEQVEAYIQESFAKWKERSRFKWNVNTDYIHEYLKD